MRGSRTPQSSTMPVVEDDVLVRDAGERAVWSIARAVRPSRAIAATGGFACPPASAICSGLSTGQKALVRVHAPARPDRREDPPAAESAEPHWPRDLGALRAELDRIDDGLHDLLMRRAEVVGQRRCLGREERGAVAAGPRSRDHAAAAGAPCGRAATADGGADLAGAAGRHHGHAGPVRDRRVRPRSGVRRSSRPRASSSVR